MIAVLADDFTGAAEIAAIGRRYGLAAEVHTTFQPEARVGLVVVDTLTRSFPRGEAAKRVAMEAARIGAARIAYKKVDSVLRGHVLAELSRLLDVSGMPRAVLVPANPSFGQLIHEQRYSIDGVPLDRTRFAYDPEHPAVTSDVLELLGPPDGVPIAYRDARAELPERGIVLTAGAEHADLLALARRLDGGTLPAGGAEFFDALLQARLGRGQAPPGGDAAPAAGRRLFVLGSVTPNSRMLIEHARSRGVPVLAMPPELYDPAAPVEPDDGAPLFAWADAVVDALGAHPSVVIAVAASEPVKGPGLRVELLPARLAEVTAAVLDRWTDGLHLYVAGGTTASVVVRRLGWYALRVTGELAHGVVSLAAGGADGPIIIVKPGGYRWPETVLRSLD